MIVEGWDIPEDEEEETSTPIATAPLATAADEGMFVRGWNEDAPGDFSYGWLMKASDKGYIVDVAVPQRDGSVKSVYMTFTKAVVMEDD